ncbi:MAG: gamma-glutamyltransferase family protein [Acidimicrobiales bacterium]
MPTASRMSAAATRHAPTGMVAGADHLASAAGVAMLRDGGNAVDAAVAAAAVMAVTGPHLCGLGGDLFALVFDGDGPPKALNASGRAGSGADPVALRVEGHTMMPPQGDIRSVTVPGCVDGWLALHDRYGSLSLVEVLEPAEIYAATGFPASPLLAAAIPFLDGVEGTEDFFTGTAVRTGDLIRRTGHARTLDAIARHGRSGFYQGEFGEALHELGRGLFTPDDLAKPLADWVEPLTARAFGHDLWTIPPNSQGYLILLGAAVADGLDVPDDPADPKWAHLLVESARAAGHDRPYVLHEDADVRPLLALEGVDARRAAISPDRAAALAWPAGPGGTTYLCAVDSDRIGVSLIQSNANGFGSKLFVPDLGIGLQNRGIGFSLEPGHPAEYAPGRRPPHTLCPAIVTRPDGSLRAVLGTMGGDSQPQILLQVLTRLLRHKEPAGSAIGAPRWTLRSSTGGGFDTWTVGALHVALEAGCPSAWAAGLRERGHEVLEMPAGHTFGHAHVIEATERGLAGAADPRAVIGDAAGY